MNGWVVTLCNRAPTHRWSSVLQLNRTCRSLQSQCKRAVRWRMNNHPFQLMMPRKILYEWWHAVQFLSGCNVRRLDLMPAHPIHDLPAHRGEDYFYRWIHSHLTWRKWLLRNIINIETKYTNDRISEKLFATATISRLNILKMYKKYSAAELSPSDSAP